MGATLAPARFGSSLGKEREPHPRMSFQERGEEEEQQAQTPQISHYLS